MTEIDSLRARIRQLEDELEEMRLVIEEMRKTLDVRSDLLSPSERVVFGLLLRQGRVSRDQMMNALYADRASEIPEPKNVDVFVCRIRRKLGVAIRGVSGFGYELVDRTRNEKVTATVEQRVA